MPLLGDAGHQALVDTLKQITTQLSKPSAILVISAHWEETLPTITSASKPSLIYDYYGFPPESYAIQYPCSGDPKLAQHIHSALEKCGITAKLDDQRGLDHGVFVPLTIMYPQADIPCVQLSLKNNLNPAEHIQIGKALQHLEYDNLLVIGSGFSFHNMRAFFAANSAEMSKQNADFEQWLLTTCSSTALSEKDREQKLIEWANAPSARFCHPREEHLLPLHVCYGMAQKASKSTFELDILNKKASMYIW